MAVRPTVQLGDPVIRSVAVEVADPLSSHVQSVIVDLVDSMRTDQLVGMAAPQIGEGVRIFVSEIRTTVYREKDEDEMDGVRVFVNPVITERSEEVATGYEGCGSVASAGLFAQVPRPARVTVRATDEKGESLTLEAEGLLARIIQHELDHLDGKVFLDRLPDMSTVIGREAYIALSKKG